MGVGLGFGAGTGCGAGGGVGVGVGRGARTGGAGFGVGRCLGVGVRSEERRGFRRIITQLLRRLLLAALRLMHVEKEVGSD
ncbi:hypothetical protein [Streptomyces sp. LaBMicrA B280]|uniref:hypothetical protein n=1 Tax=Streptomyces sp. LaBMicrA B280 TaxID=3391001 RepID=UPI003BA46B34